MGCFSSLWKIAIVGSIVGTLMAKEGRKFGLDLICASQSPGHFSDDFVSNAGTKIILGID
jgi:DNA helicase HerA-like ATPase